MRRAFTLVELLVVLALIGLLAALLPPAIDAVVWRPEVAAQQPAEVLLPCRAKAEVWLSQTRWPVDCNLVRTHGNWVDIVDTHGKAYSVHSDQVYIEWLEGGLPDRGHIDVAERTILENHLIALQKRMAALEKREAEEIVAEAEASR